MILISIAADGYIIFLCFVSVSVEFNVVWTFFNTAHQKAETRTIGQVAHFVA